jgi:hypothetical protein
MDFALIEKVNRDYRKVMENMEGSGNPASKQFEDLKARMVEKNFTMSGKPFPTFLKPLFIPRSMMEYFARTTQLVMGCLEKVSDLYFSEPDYRKYFEMDPLEAELAEINPRYPRRIINARLDAFLTTGGIRFLEFNCDSPCGMGWHDELIKLFDTLPIMDELRKKYNATFDSLLARWLPALRGKSEQFGNPEGAAFAVVCEDTSSVVEDLRLMARFFDANGQPAVWSDMRWGKYDGETLKMDGTPVKLVFRDAIQEFTEYMDETKPVLDAYRDGKIAFVNPFSSRLGGLKCVMWFMTDEKSQQLFTDEEKEVIRATVPWTRFMHEGKTLYRDREVDLVPFVRGNKDTFILKPNAGYGGFGVTIGPAVDQGTWEKAVDETAKASWVVQEFVDIPVDEFPHFEDGTVFRPKNVNINFFAFDGQFGGGMVRISESAVINVHQGGGLVPICYVEEK